jgi:dephospho-CoA kinase
MSHRTGIGTVLASPKQLSSRSVQCAVMLLVGLTGGIGAGKSTVAEMLAGRGAVVVDADVVARDVVEPGQPAFDAVVARFGTDVVGPDGRLDRPRLGERIFADPEARRDLEGITHPAINTEFLRRVAEAPAGAIVVLDVPLLVESATASARGYEAVIVVEAPRDVRLARLEQRGVPRADAEARMMAQASDDQRRTVATWVLDNGGDREYLEAQVERVWADLEQRLRGCEPE